MDGYKQGKMFQRFKEKIKFVIMFKHFNVTKLTMIFKINIVKLANKYLKLKNSLLSFNFVKTYFKDIKEICKENSEKFK